MKVENNSGNECAICMEDAPKRALLSCFCARACPSCTLEALGRDATCPMCRKPGVEILHYIFV